MYLFTLKLNSSKLAIKYDILIKYICFIVPVNYEIHNQLHYNLFVSVKLNKDILNYVNNFLSIIF